MVVALHGELRDGYAAVDDFEFLLDSVSCETKPPHPDTCAEGQLPCADKQGCYMKVIADNVFIFKKHAISESTL